MRFERDGIGQPASPAGTGHGLLAVVDGIEAEAAPKQARLDREIGQSGRNALVVDIQRHAGLGGAPKRIGDHHQRLSGADHAWKFAEHEGAGAYVLLALADVVDKQFDRRGHGRIGREPGHRIDDQVGAHAEVPPPLQAAEPHRTRPRQPAGDHVAGGPGGQPQRVRIGPAGVEPGVGIAAGIVKPADARGFERAPAAERAQRSSQRQRLDVTGGSSEGIPVQAHAAVALGLHCAWRAVAQVLQSTQAAVGRQHKALLGGVEGGTEARHGVDRHQSVGFDRQSGRDLESRQSQFVGRQEQAPTTLRHGNERAHHVAVEDEVEIQRLVGRGACVRRGQRVDVLRQRGPAQRGKRAGQRSRQQAGVTAPRPGRRSSAGH